jgi:arylsulfatase A-like enzyme
MRFVRNLLFLLGLFGATAGTVAAAEQKPNVIFILADDLGWRDVGCFGSTFYKTPNIDRLAARGVRFTQAYAASPLCSPTRSSILTGLYPARIGITLPDCHLPVVRLEKRLVEKAGPNAKAISAESLTRLKPDYVTLAESLHEAGYATAHFGKWHLGWNRKDHPEDHYEPKDQGFDSDFPHAPSAPGPVGGYLAPWSFIRDPPLDAPPGTHIEDRMSDEAAAFIRAHTNQPFYVNYWTYSVHSPWNARADDIKAFQASADEKNPQHNALYAAMVHSLDDGVGRLLKAVDESGLADRTIIVFFSDNGGYAYPPKVTDPEGFSDMPATSNLPLRSGKASIYEGGTREPCIVVWPGRAKPGTVSDALLQSVDWYPTLLNLCGLQPHRGQTFDGVDQTSALLGQRAVRDRVFCHFPHGSARAAKDIPGFMPSAYVRKNDWKLIRFFADNNDGSDRFELYNLKNDVGEARDLAAADPERVRELNGLLTGFLHDTDAVIPVRNPAYDPLAGCKAHGCEASVTNGVLTLRSTGTAPFLGIGVGRNAHGPVTVALHLRTPVDGTGKLECVTPGKPGEQTTTTRRATFALQGGYWQTPTVDIPGQKPFGILRVYLPVQKQPVEIDWIELRFAHEKQPRRIVF